eukprot:c4055_g1_i1.p1 GENE.c4055_g1_i1~~c4055_g1_i1.p1  ORF type:complete len:442 (+),score=73.35 c4055_g1_i1:136-1326(+)
MTYSTIVPKSADSVTRQGRLIPRVCKNSLSLDTTTLIPLSWTSNKRVEEDADTEVSIWKKSMSLNFQVVLLILWWYVLGSASNNVSKVLLLRFPFPLTLSMMQALAPATSFLWIIVNRHLRQKYRQQDEVAKTSTVSFSTFLAHWKWGVLLGVCSICGGVLHRVSLLHMHVSFVHTVKATQPLFAAAIARFWLKETLPTKAYLSLIPIVVGVILAAINEIDMNIIGLSSCLISTFVLCLSNVASKKMMQETCGSKDHPALSKDAIFYFTALYALSMMWILWVVIDLPILIQGMSNLSAISTREILFLLLLNSILTSLQNYTSLWVLSHVTSVSHAVATTFKRIFIIIFAVAYFHNAVSPINIVGVVISSLGVGIYQLTKRSRFPNVVSIGDIASTV